MRTIIRKKDASDTLIVVSLLASAAVLYLSFISTLGIA